MYLSDITPEMHRLHKHDCGWFECPPSSIAAPWFCEAHRLWTTSDCPKCDDDLIGEVAS